MPTLVRAVFPGTFDPITLGHEDMLRRACALFGEVIVAVAMAHHKKTLFTLDERLAITRQALADHAQGARGAVRGLGDRICRGPPRPGDGARPALGHRF